MTTDVRHIGRHAFTLICALLASGSLGAQAPQPRALPEPLPTQAAPAPLYWDQPLPPERQERREAPP